MFSELLETAPRRHRSVLGPVASVIVHAVVIAATIFGTLHAAERRSMPTPDILIFTDPGRSEPPRRTIAAPPDATVGSSAPEGSLRLPSPLDLSDALPPIDLTPGDVDAGDFGETSVAGVPHGGVEGGRTPVTDGTWFEFQVEKQVIGAPGSPAPRYPDLLRSGGVEGEVQVQFVVDTTGRAVPGSLRILGSTHDLFTLAVRSALPHMRFLPAEIGGQKVRQVVQQRFSFATSN